MSCRSESPLPPFSVHVSNTKPLTATGSRGISSGSTNVTASAAARTSTRVPIDQPLTHQHAAAIANEAPIRPAPSSRVSPHSGIPGVCTAPTRGRCKHSVPGYPICPSPLHSPAPALAQSPAHAAFNARCLKREDAMDFDSPWTLFSGLLIGLAGFGLFIYGKKQANFKCLATGLVMCAYPYFVTSLLLLWLIAAACVGGLFLLHKIE